MANETIIDVDFDPNATYEDLQDDLARYSAALELANQIIDAAGYEPVSPDDIELDDDDTNGDMNPLTISRRGVQYVRPGKKI